jgi:hypothetical protein
VSVLFSQYIVSTGIVPQVFYVLHGPESSICHLLHVFLEGLAGHTKESKTVDVL